MVKKDTHSNDEKGSSNTEEPTQKKDKVSGRANAKADANEPSAATNGACEEFSEEIAADLEELDALAKALAEADELRDSYLRLKAEWENYRKRTEAERTEERSRAAQGLVEKLLPVIDDLERAVEHSDAASEDSLKDGIVQVYGKVQEVLASEGVKVIDPKGEPFDANLHSAISKVEDNKVPDETVLEVYQKGYEMGNRVLRAAMVVVSSKR